jgi:hypothetical protein
MSVSLDRGGKCNGRARQGKGVGEPTHAFVLGNVWGVGASGTVSTSICRGPWAVVYKRTTTSLEETLCFTRRMPSPAKATEYSLTMLQWMLVR